MNRHCPKNDYKLNYDYTYPFLNDLVFFRDYNCFLQFRKQLLILLYPN